MTTRGDLRTPLKRYTAKTALRAHPLSESPRYATMARLSRGARMRFHSALGDPPQLAERLGVGPLTRAVIAFGDPFTTPINQLLQVFNETCPRGLPLIGGMASSAQGPGENVLARNDGVLDDGLVGVSLSGP